MGRRGKKKKGGGGGGGVRAKQKKKRTDTKQNTKTNKFTLTVGAKASR